MYIKSNGSWKAITDFFIKVGGAWKQVTEGYIKVSGAWKQFWGGASLKPQFPLEIEGTVNSTTYLVNLTGRNYHWRPIPTALTFYFEWSTNNGSTWNEINSGSINNPSFNLSNTKSYIVQPSAPPVVYSPNVENLYRFRVFATKNTTSGTITGNAASTSNPSATYKQYSLQGPRNITLTETTVPPKTATTFGVDWTPSTYANRYYVELFNGLVYVFHSWTSNTYAVFTGLEDDTEYEVRVTPYTGTASWTTGNPAPLYKGYPGNTATITVKTGIGKPKPLGGASITGDLVEGGTITLNAGNWNAGSCPITNYYYNLQYYDATFGEWINYDDEIVSTLATAQAIIPLDYIDSYGTLIRLSVYAANCEGKSIDSNDTIGYEVEPATKTYYKGMSVCNAQSGCYVTAPYYTGVTAQYVEGEQPADVVVGEPDSREKTVWRLTQQEAIEAAAQAACITCTFHTITATAGTGGSISPSGAVSVATFGSKTFTITPDSGYSILRVLIDGLDLGVYTEYTFTNVTSDRTIEAVFAEQTYYCSSREADGTVGNFTSTTDVSSTCVACALGTDATFYPGAPSCSGSGGGTDPCTCCSIDSTQCIPTYYKAQSTCNLNTFCYGVAPYFTGETAQYTNPPADNLSGSESARTKTVWRPTEAGAIAAAAQTNCTTCQVKTYYEAYSSCNTSDGCYISAPALTGNSQQYQEGSQPADSISGLPSFREKFVWRDTEAGAVAAAAQATCINCTATYTITATAGTGGSISPSGAVSVTAGGSKSFTITANSGYGILRVEIDGIDSGPLTSYTFTNVTSNRTIAAFFSSAVYYCTSREADGTQGNFTSTTDVSSSCVACALGTSSADYPSAPACAGTGGGTDPCTCCNLINNCNVSPNFPNFVSPNFPNFPNFVSPNFPNFPNFVSPNFPNFPNFVSPNFPNFALPQCPGVITNPASVTCAELGRVDLGGSTQYAIPQGQRCCGDLISPNFPNFVSPNFPTFTPSATYYGCCCDGTKLNIVATSAAEANDYFQNTCLQSYGTSVCTSATTNANISCTASPNFPNFVAPNFPNFVAPNFPNFVAPNFPNFVAPNFPNFVTPNFPNFVTPNFPNFVTPNFPNFVTPNFPNFVTPNFPNFTGTTGRTCTSFDINAAVCSGAGCDSSGCASGATCSGAQNLAGSGC